jgi:hypothetical protein
MGLLAIALYTAGSLIDLRLPFLLFSFPLMAGLILLPRLELKKLPAKNSLPTP